VANLVLCAARQYTKKLMAGDYHSKTIQLLPVLRFPLTWSIIFSFSSYFLFMICEVACQKSILAICANPALCSFYLYCLFYYSNSAKRVLSLISFHAINFCLIFLHLFFYYLFRYFPYSKISKSFFLSRFHFHIITSFLLLLIMIANGG